MYAISNLSVIPVRKEPAHKSEMMNHLLFGELVTTEELQGDWIKITGTFDGYEGWADRRQLFAVEDAEAEKILKAVQVYTMDLVQLVVLGQNKICPVVYGSSLPLFNSGELTFSGNQMRYDGNVSQVTKPDI